MTFKSTLYLIAAFQLALGVVFLVPGLFESLIGLDPTPDWANWIFAMLGGRALGFAYGMVIAAREPARHRSWVKAMAAIQAIDWVATIAYVMAGAVSLAQVTTAAFMPVVFVLVLASHLRAQRPVAATEST
jgi:membrane-bound acyltransferase YfiQ involved in biofilm formation